MISIVAAGLLFSVSLTMADQPSTKDIYVVNAKIYDQNTLIGSPMVALEANKEGSIKVTSKSGGNIYHLSLLLKKLSEKTVDVSINLKLKDKEVTPRLGVELDKEAVVAVGETKLSMLVTKMEYSDFIRQLPN